MAKRQVTENDLATGMKAFGGFPTFASSQPLRDNPFRDTRQTTPLVSPPKVIEKVAKEPKPRVIEKPLAKEVRKAVVELPVVANEPEIVEEEIKAPTVKAEVVSAPVVKVAPQVATRPEREVQTVPRNELLYERVTLPMTAEMRENYERMARELQRKRSQKNERITANTVMRVALEFFMNQFSVERTDRVNTEEELLDAAKKQLGGE